MRYLPKSPDERKQMLAEIGARSIDDLFAVIPAEYRITRDSTCRFSRPRAKSWTTFAPPPTGTPPATPASWARAPIALPPVIIDSLVQRGEFLTSYTPYQAEITKARCRPSSNSRP